MIRQAAAACPNAKRPGRRGGALVQASVAWRSVVTMTFAMAVVTATAPVVTTVLAEVTAIVASVFPVIAAIIPALMAKLLAAMAMLFAVARCVFVAVPVVTHEIDALATGAVTPAVLAPMLGMAGRYAQVKRRTSNRHPLDHHRLREEQGRLREAADIDAAVEAGLANADRNLGGGGGAENRGAKGKSQKQTFHFVFLMG